MNQRERIAKAMYEAPDPDQTESTTPWPPSHPEDLAWWLSRADAALAAFDERATVAPSSKSLQTSPAGLAAVFAKVTRLTVVREDGTYFEKYDMYRSGVEIHIQDEGRTMKVFPRSVES